MKYVVVCYSVHDMAVASCDMFPTEEEALDFMKKDARSVYDEEKQQGNRPEYEDCGDIIYVASCGKDAEWTWQICPVHDK